MRNLLKGDFQHVVWKVPLHILGTLKYQPSLVGAQAKAEIDAKDGQGSNPMRLWGVCAWLKQHQGMLGLEEEPE